MADQNRFDEAFCHQIPSLGSILLYMVVAMRLLFTAFLSSMALRWSILDLHLHCSYGLLPTPYVYSKLRAMPESVEVSDWYMYLYGVQVLDRQTLSISCPAGGVMWRRLTRHQAGRASQPACLSPRGPNVTIATE
jgi:hypothetical protein